MAALDGRISRDEIIVGPMSIGNDMDTEEFQSSVNLLRKLRSTLRGTETAINELSRKIGIKLDTMKNYTRIPIGVLLWTGWATKQRGYFVLTGVGKADLKSAEEARDIRLEYFANLQTKFQIPLVRVSFYEMLSRAGFDTNPVRSTLEEDRRTLVLGGFKQNRTILLSPFQQLDDSILDATFEEKRSPIVGTPTANVSAAPGPGRASEGSRITLRQSAPASSAAASGTDEIRRVLQETLKTTGNAQSETIDVLHSRFGKAGKDEFYPLVTGLFNIAGFLCELTRIGVNPMRADARIVLKDDTIPVEIKSPSEETEISVKAVRQAVENKIVFVSRKMFPCNPETTTLIVGYNPPNARSEVYDLIWDFKKCFDISVGIFDLRNLLALAIAKLMRGFAMGAEDLKALGGLAIVESA